jgi:hypothetical protein
MAVSLCALALGGCAKTEVKTGSLTQRFTMVDAEGRQFGVVELDPVNGGSIHDVQGRMVGRITAPMAAPTAVASANLAPIEPIPMQ